MAPAAPSGGGDGDGGGGESRSRKWCEGGGGGHPLPGDGNVVDGAARIEGEVHDAAMMRNPSAPRFHDRGSDPHTRLGDPVEQERQDAHQDEYHHCLCASRRTLHRRVAGDETSACGIGVDAVAKDVATGLGFRTAQQ